MLPQQSKHQGKRLFFSSADSGNRNKEELIVQLPSSKAVVFLLCHIKIYLKNSRAGELCNKVGRAGIKREPGLDSLCKNEENRILVLESFLRTFSILSVGLFHSRRSGYCRNSG